MRVKCTNVLSGFQLSQISDSYSISNKYYGISTHILFSPFLSHIPFVLPSSLPYIRLPFFFSFILSILNMASPSNISRFFFNHFWFVLVEVVLLCIIPCCCWGLKKGFEEKNGVVAFIFQTTAFWFFHWYCSLNIHSLSLSLFFSSFPSFHHLSDLVQSMKY